MCKRYAKHFTFSQNNHAKPYNNENNYTPALNLAGVEAEGVIAIIKNCTITCNNCILTALLEHVYSLLRGKKQ